MKIIINLLLFTFFLSSCTFGSYNYEAFKYHRDGVIGLDVSLWKWNKKKREIYDDKHYIYKNNMNECIFGYLTNKDNKKEIVVDWIILSGKEYCKEQYLWAL